MFTRALAFHIYTDIEITLHAHIIHLAPTYDYMSEGTSFFDCIFAKFIKPEQNLTCIVSQLIRCVS